MSSDPRRLGVAEIQHLQRAVGNTAVCALIRDSASRPAQPAAVQRAPEPPAVKPGFAERLRAGITKAVDLITDFLPGASNAKDFTIFLTGTNPVTGEKVGITGRLTSLVFAIPGVGTAVKVIGRGARMARNYVMGPLRTAGWKLVTKSRALLPWIRRARAAAARTAREAANKTRERLGRAAEKMGLKDARVGHNTPWDSMTPRQQAAFQHSYSNHGKDFGLPNWSAKNAENLREQFNAAAKNVRENAQNITVRYKPVNGVTEPVRYFQYTDGGGTRFYYFETLKGDFVSAGREIP